jgi:predicted transcriptional regulator
VYRARDLGSFGDITGWSRTTTLTLLHRAGKKGRSALQREQRDPHIFPLIARKTR